jgi:hypothetical protein
MIDRTNYDKIAIPENLDAVVGQAIDEGLSKRRRRTWGVWKKAGSIAAVLVLCTVSALNLSPAFASAACRLPVVGELCQVLLFREYHTEDEIKYVDVKIPRIAHTEQPDLESLVNQEIQRVVQDCIQESEARAKDYYDAFVSTGGDPAEFIPLGITIDYEIKYVSPECVSFVVFQRETRFSAYNCDLYYNLDLNSGEVITLKDLFGKDYRQIVANSIQDSIETWSEEERSILWEDLSIPDLISEDTDFYFNQDGQAVVVIGKYQAAYGAAGSLEFVIQPPAPVK